MSNRILRNQLVVYAIALAVGILVGWWAYQAQRELDIGHEVEFGITTGVIASGLVVVVLWPLFRLFSRYVFISYARADEAFARTLRRKMRRAGIKVWMDHKLRLGDEFPSVLERKIDRCAGLVLLMSPASAGSEWVEREARHAADQGKPVLPILLEGQPFDWIVGKYQYLDADGSRRFWRAYFKAIARYTG